MSVLPGMRALPATVLLLAAVGCGSSAPEEGEVRGTRDLPGPVVTVVDAGAAPRQELRFGYAAGDSQRLTMSMDMDMDITIDGRRQPTGDVPVMDMAMQVDVTDVAEGIATARFRYTDTDVRATGPQATAMRKSLQQLEGVRGTVRATDRGGLVTGDLEIPDDVDPVVRSTLESLEDQLGAMAVPLPEEAVGPGAVWTAITTPEINGIKARIETRYELRRRDGDRVTVATSYHQTATAQDVDLPGMPEDASAHIDSMDVRGHGVTVLALGEMLPVRIRSAADGPIRMTLEQGEKRARMEQVLHLVMTMR